jgi:hypothetical protein
MNPHFRQSAIRPVNAAARPDAHSLLRRNRVQAQGMVDRATPESIAAQPTIYERPLLLCVAMGMTAPSRDRRCATSCNTLHLSDRRPA